MFRGLDTANVSGAVRAMQQAQQIPGLVMAVGLLLMPLSAGRTAEPPNPMPEHELTRTQATALVQKRYAARVVRAASADESGRHMYVFRLLSEGGKVWSVRIDARSGAEVP